MTDCFFSGWDSSTGDELWSTDETSEGTRQEADIRPGDKGSSPSELVAANAGLYFLANDGLHGREVWKFVTDEVDAALADFNEDGSVDFDDFLILSTNFGRDGRDRKRW